MQGGNLAHAVNGDSEPANAANQALKAIDDNDDNRVSAAGARAPLASAGAPFFASGVGCGRVTTTHSCVSGRVAPAVHDLP